MAVTDCLNFGNPQKPEIMSEFVASVEAIAKAGELLDAPVISGNVSFYNETLGENIISTPAIGVVAIRDSVEDLIGDVFSMPFESVIQVRLHWVESWIYVNDKSEFVLNPLADVPGFIKKCAELNDKIKSFGKQVSAIKAIGLGGTGIACLKMSRGDIGVDLGFDSGAFPEKELFKDIFYGFLLSTPENSDDFISFLKTHFDSSAVEIRKVGETKNETIKFIETSLKFKEFQSQFFNEMEMVSV